MHTILDYIKWRGDLTFEERPLNHIDYLICSVISYFPFEKVVQEEDCILTVEELYQEMVKNQVREKDFLMFNDAELLKLLAKSKRYKDLKLTRFVSVTNLDKEKQFAALTVLLPNHYVYISYRGTDDSFVGWKEDFNMTYLDVVPAQLSAVQYLDELKPRLFTKILVGGHSKGGNLAIYAALHCQNKIKSRIKHVFNYDGPGFLKDITEKLSTPNFWRLRLGTGHPRTLGLAQPVADFVLHAPSGEHKSLILECISAALKTSNDIACGDMARVQRAIAKYGTPKPKKEDTEEK